MGVWTQTAISIKKDTILIHEILIIPNLQLNVYCSDKRYSVSHNFIYPYLFAGNFSPAYYLWLKPDQNLPIEYLNKCT